MELPHRDNKTLLRVRMVMGLAASQDASSAQPVRQPRIQQMAPILQRQLVQPRIFMQRRKTVQQHQSLFFAAREFRSAGESKERSVAERALLRADPSGQILAPLPFPLSIAERHNSPRAAQGVPAEESSLPERVIRKLRRVEERPLQYARPSVAMRFVTPGSEEAARARQPRKHSISQPDADPEAAVVGRAAQPPAAVNVTQITDAVLQQLDRRLVAARERMGRI